MLSRREQGWPAGRSTRDLEPDQGEAGKLGLWPVGPLVLTGPEGERRCGVRSPKMVLTGSHFRCPGRTSGNVLPVLVLI